MASELYNTIDALSREKGIDPQIVVTAVEDAIVVAVTRDGAIYLGQNKVDPSQLGSMVRDKLADKTDKMIYVRADERAQYKVVEDAIDDVRTAGVEEVGLLTQRREGNQIGGQ